MCKTWGSRTRMRIGIVLMSIRIRIQILTGINIEIWIQNGIKTIHNTVIESAKFSRIRLHFLYIVWIVFVYARRSTLDPLLVKKLNFENM
jgi:hypothetical protein